ncbi:MAG: cellulose biosynthesis protein BcsF [Aquipseudomonas alcaligenes]|uniref:Cellulose biosynthesis protein BcsF n=1 Tax=Aquipseudomonas alcaligenes TaxID=43263 RepID=A0A5C7VXM1_AQUAC|nr:MAG: cellulose biosynthesis protein BcsF [Pseudomonas alcaligenes]
MNIAQLMQVVLFSALVTLALVLLGVRLRALVRERLLRRLPPRYLKPAGVRRREEAGNA